MASTDLGAMPTIGRMWFCAGPQASLADFGHADSASKPRAPARWGSSDGYEILTFDELFRKIGVLAKLFNIASGGDS